MKYKNRQWILMLKALAGVFLFVACTPSHQLSVTEEGEEAHNLLESPSKAPRSVPAYRLSPDDQLHIRVVKVENGSASTISPKEVLKLDFSFGGEDYHIMPGDQLSIAFADDSGENLEVTVRPDGKVTFPEIGEEQASTLTPVEFANVINRLYEGKLNDPTATVSVDKANTKAIDVMNGEFQVREDGKIAVPVLGQFQAVGQSYSSLTKQLENRASEKFSNKIQANISNPISKQMKTREQLNQNLVGYDSIQRVSSGGDVVLPSIGGVRAKGKTLPQFRSAIKSKTERFLGAKVDVSVILESSQKKQFFISGQVNRPGQYKLSDSMTVLKAIAKAGGVNEDANRKEIRLIHHNPKGQIVVYRTSLSSIRKEGYDIFDLPLSPQDVIYVPRSGVAEANLFVSQYINKMLPFSRGVSYTYSEVPTQTIPAP